MSDDKVSFFKETLGLHPIGTRLKQAKIALLGEEDVPRTKFGLSSLSQLHPSISIPLWRGKQLVKRKVILSNLFNHKQSPVENGWSVQKTQVQDFRDKNLTYNSHNGTDLAIPIGTKVLTAAPGEIVAIKREFNRGGLKIFIDHGNGLMTVSVHLARALVEVGDIVKRGKAIAVSGYSGLDGFITCPWGIPHVHYNTWLNCEPVDPFSFGSEISLWRNGNEPIPFSAEDENETFVASEIDEGKLEEAIASVITPKVKERLSAISDLKTRGTETVIEMNYYPTRFSKRINVYKKEHARTPVLDLPFLKEEFDGVIFMDEMIDL